MAFLKARRRAVLLRRLRRMGPAALPVPPAAARGARAGVGQEPVQLQPADLGRRAGRAPGDPRLQPGAGPDHHVAMLAADLDLDNLVERLGGSAHANCSGRWCARGSARSRSRTRSRRRCWPRRSCGTCWRACTRAAGSCIGIPDLVGRAVRDDPRGGQAVQRHLPAAQGDPHDRRQRLHHRLLDHPARPLQPAGAAAQAAARRSRAPNQPRALLRRDRGQRGGEQRAAERPDREAARPGEGAYPRARRATTGATGRRAPGRWPAAASGFYALPEQGDQVLVAFAHGDLSEALRARQPVDGRSSGRPSRTPDGPTASA